MPELISPTTILTPAEAGSRLQSNGLTALGLTVPLLSSAWADQTPVIADVDRDQLTLRLAGIRAPFNGTLHTLTAPPEYRQLSGVGVGQNVSVIRLHPQARLRLFKLVEQRLGSPLIRPVPLAMLVHRGTTALTPEPVRKVRAGELIDDAPSDPAVVSFHDARGLPIDPLAVAAMLRDLIAAHPPLHDGDSTMPTLSEPGGLDGIISLAASAGDIRCHIMNPHGRPFHASDALRALKLIDTGGAELADVSGTTLVSLEAEQRLGRSDDDLTADTDALEDTQRQAPLYWGWCYNSQLTRTPLAPPALPAGVDLPVQFFRVVAVDLDWHLLGNRTALAIDGVPADDQRAPVFAQPVVRPTVAGFRFLADGVDVLGECAAMAQGWPAASDTDALALIVAPEIDSTLSVPSDAGPAGHWPAFPAPNTGAALDNTADVTRDMEAVFLNADIAGEPVRDVAITIAADAVPAGCHIRIFERRFSVIRFIGQQPSFVRGDGGASVSVAATPTQVMLKNPFALKNAETVPDPAILQIDIVVTDRLGHRRLSSGIAVSVSAPSAADIAMTPSLGGIAVLELAPLVAAMDSMGSTSVSPSPLFGVQGQTAATGPVPSDPLTLVRGFASETASPRVGPRWPTQMRFESIFALGATPSAGTARHWRAVVSAARWTNESRSARHELGNPGNPAGPDVYLAGVRCEGQLAADVAVHALKRVQPVFPLGGTTPGWLQAMASDEWDDPAPDSAGSVAGVLLETIAPVTDTPELSLPFIPVPTPDDSVQDIADALGALLGISAPTIPVPHEERLKRLVQREMISAKFGHRDLLWSVRRAIRQASDFIYIESPAFAATALPEDPADPLAHEIDWVSDIRERLIADSRLRLMLCLPRHPDFDQQKEAWMRSALARRTLALHRVMGLNEDGTEDEEVTAEADGRQIRQQVAAFHPIGIPGRASAVRSTVIIVDDVWASVGSSHARRRGLTFDGGADVVCMDRDFDAQGRSSMIASFRQRLMAGKLGVEQGINQDSASALWTRLASGQGAFDVLSDLLSKGQSGRCTPIWAGPPASDTSVIPHRVELSDPDGVDSDGSRLFALLFPHLLDG